MSCKCCKCKTLSGKSCSRQPEEGSKYCWQHKSCKKMSSSVKVSPKRYEKYEDGIDNVLKQVSPSCNLTDDARKFVRSMMSDLIMADITSTTIKGIEKDIENLNGGKLSLNTIREGRKYVGMSFTDFNFSGKKVVHKGMKPTYKVNMNVKDLGIKLKSKENNYLSAVIEYLSAEVLEVTASKIRRGSKKECMIDVKDLKKAISDDEELKLIF